MLSIQTRHANEHTIVSTRKQTNYQITIVQVYKVDVQTSKT